MSKKLMVQRTPLSCALVAATAVMGMTFAVQASAFPEIPLTLQDAQAVADADQQSNIAVGAQLTTINGSGPTAAKAWNGYEQAKAAADVDVNLKGGEGLAAWSVQGADLGTPTPEVIAEYGVANKWDVDARFKRFRHVSSDVGLVDPTAVEVTGTLDLTPYFKDTALEQVRDVYAVNGRLFVLPQMTVTAGYQLDHRTGDLSLSNRSAGVPIEQAYAIRDNHHQAKAGVEYLGSNWAVSADYYLSKFENDNDEFIGAFLKGGATTYTVRSLDPSNTLHRIGMNATYQPTDRTTVGMRASYTWNELDSTGYGEVTGKNTVAQSLYATGADASVKMPEFTIGLTSRPLDALSVKLDYSFRKMDYSVTPGLNAKGVEDIWYDGSYKENKLRGNAIYSFGRGYSVKVHGKYQKREYLGDYPEGSTYTLIDSLTTYGAGVELRKRMSNLVTGSVGYTYQGRNTKGWHLDTGLNGFGPAYEWNWLGYNQHSVDFRLTATPADALTVSLLGSIYKRDYKAVDPTYLTHKSGLIASYEDAMTDAKGFMFGIDVDWTPSRDWNVFAFYNYDRLTSNAHSNWITTVRATGQNLPVVWDSDNKSASHTLGLGFGLHPVNQPWKATFRYVFGYDTDQYVMINKVKNHVRTHYATAKLDYKLSDRWSLMGATAYGHGGSYDLHRSGNDYYAGDTGVDIINSPNYNFFAVYIGAKYLLK